ncbi:hypothetical protein, conserved [Eimeria necatrix]|uniref:RRM domain-containing protein n=1 Tax=Eimeria necatrix TaxID=51315 RepID=U6N0J7_9EIME|nr:hypothetical protein, conserved [Eimeria necatrix]CDJ69998.1 hypothetical protein, conserved [Eimeria necatrix]
MHRMDDEMTQGRKVYVGNLDPESTSSELEEIFRRYGKLSNIWVARNPPGFAFVTFEDARDARDAVEATDGILHREKYLRVEIAKGPGAKGRRAIPDIVVKAATTTTEAAGAAAVASIDGGPTVHAVATTQMMNGT